MGNVSFVRTRDNETYTVTNIQDLTIDFSMDVEDVPIPDENQPEVIVVGGVIMPMTITFIVKKDTLSEFQQEVTKLRNFFATGYFGEEYQITIEDWDWQLTGSIKGLRLRQREGVPYVLEVVLRISLGEVI